MPSSTLVSASTSASAAPRPLGRLVGELPRPVGPMLEHVAVLVEDVVDDLEEQPELVRRTRATAAAPASGTSAAQSAQPDRGGEQAARLQPVQRGEVGAGRR